MDYEKLVSCRNKKELKRYFKENGRKLSEIDTDNLKKLFSHKNFSENTLNLEQLKNIAGGWEIHIYKNKSLQKPYEATPLLLKPTPITTTTTTTTTTTHEQALVPEQEKSVHSDIELGDGRIARIVNDRKYKFTVFEYSENGEVEKTTKYNGFHDFKNGNGELSNQIMPALKNKNESTAEDIFIALNSQDGNSMFLFDPHGFYEQAHSRPDGIQLQSQEHNITAKALEIDLNGEKQHCIHLTDDKSNQTFYLLSGDVQVVNFEPQCSFLSNGDFSLGYNFVDFLKTLKVGNHQIGLGEKTLIVTHNEDHSLRIEHNGRKEIFIPVEKKFGTEDLHVSLDKDGNILDFNCSSPRNIILDGEKTFFDESFHLRKFVIEGSKARGEVTDRTLDAIVAFNDKSSMILFSNTANISIQSEKIELSENVAEYLFNFLPPDGCSINLQEGKCLKLSRGYSEEKRKTIFTVSLEVNGQITSSLEVEAKTAKDQLTDAAQMSKKDRVAINAEEIQRAAEQMQQKKNINTSTEKSLQSSSGEESESSSSPSSSRNESPDITESEDGSVTSSRSSFPSLPESDDETSTGSVDDELREFEVACGFKLIKSLEELGTFEAIGDAEPADSDSKIEDKISRFYIVDENGEIKLVLKKVLFSFAMSTILYSMSHKRYVANMLKNGNIEFISDEDSFKAELKKYECTTYTNDDETALIFFEGQAHVNSNGTIFSICSIETAYADQMKTYAEHEEHKAFESLEDGSDYRSAGFTEQEGEAFGGLTGGAFDTLGRPVEKSVIIQQVNNLEKREGTVPFFIYQDGNLKAPDLSKPNDPTDAVAQAREDFLEGKNIQYIPFLIKTTITNKQNDDAFIVVLIEKNKVLTPEDREFNEETGLPKFLEDFKDLITEIIQSIPQNKSDKATQKLIQTHGENEMNRLFDEIPTNSKDSKNINNEVHSLITDLIIAGFSTTTIVGIVLLVVYLPNLFKNIPPLPPTPID